MIMPWNMGVKQLLHAPVPVYLSLTVIYATRVTCTAWCRRSCSFAWPPT